MNISPEEQLRAVTKAQGRMSEPHRQGRRHLGLLMIALGAILGAAHVGIVVFPPDRNLPLFLAVSSVGVVAISVISALWLKFHRVTPAGGGRRYLLALFASLALYLNGLLVFIFAAEPLWLAGIIAVLIAAPLVIAGVREIRR